VEGLAAWSGLEIVKPLTGGHRNQVLLAERGGQRCVLRRSARPAASLDWELDLLEHLRANGVGSPPLVPTDDGRRHVDGVQLHRFVTGRPPADTADWRRVVDVVAAVHELTAGWPQRPGFQSSRALLAQDRGGDVHLDVMPPVAVDAVREAWQPIHVGPDCVIHGDLGVNNVLIDDSGVMLLDWDEARVDVPWFDFAFVPDDVEVPAPVERDALVTAGVAWEAATCWVAEPEYAARRLAELAARTR
jgi:Ser/Thr protein kinase RdoA (MazF antagonist)